jgi:large subunit ribosomal protein L27
MAHTKAKGTSKLGRDSIAKRLGVKIYGGMIAKAGDIIIRQRGSKFFAGNNVAMGKDDTIYATVDGEVKFQVKHIKKFNGNLEKTRVVNVLAK